MKIKDAALKDIATFMQVERQKQINEKVFRNEIINFCKGIEK